MGYVINNRNKFPLNALVSALSLMAASTAMGAVSTSELTASNELPTINVIATLDQKYNVKRSSTATKTDTLLRDTPQSIGVVSNDQIRDTAAQGLAEATRYVPGLGFQQGEGNRETPIFRGFSTTADFFVDGIRDDVQYYRDLYNIERVEVLKGPNGMIFGRSAVGGLINRVTKAPEWKSSLAGSITHGSDDNRRITVDANQVGSDNIAVRINGLYENSNSYRDGVHLERSGINPTISFKPADKTLLTFGYEHFRADWIADRGIPSFKGKPIDTGRSTFFGSAALSPTDTELDAVTAVFSHEFDHDIKITNRTRWSDQDKFYQNVFPGAVNSAGTAVAISAYNNATTRKSMFNQTDLNLKFDTAGIWHSVLLGAEASKQKTQNLRQTGYFNAAGTATSASVPVSNPTYTGLLNFKQSTTDANNSSEATTLGIYLQDQIELNRYFQVIAGVRYDNYKNDFLDKRNGKIVSINAKDSLVSPRFGVIYKPVEPVSIYANYSLAYQPRSGDQLSSLSVTNKELDPEKFTNYELGTKWDFMENLAATLAIYRLNRTNVIILDPNDATKTILGDGQRSQGVELALTGNITPEWSINAGYAYTEAKFTADTSATLRDGAKVGQVPKHTVAFWNRYDVTPVLGFGLGVTYKSKMLASNELIATTTAPIPNVELPSYLRTDAALYYKVNQSTQLQLNVENLFDEKYYISANSNNNITPGSPRAFRVGLNFKF